MAELLRKTGSFGLGLFDEFVAVAVALSGFAIIALAAGVALFAVTHIFTGRMAWRRRRAVFFGMLCGMGDRDILWLAGQILRLLFVTAIVCFGIEPGLPHVLLFAGLFASEAVCAHTFGVGRLLFSLLNNAVIFGAVLATDMLYGFMRDVRGDSRIMCVAVLMALFTITYSLYFTLRDLSDMTERANCASGQGDAS